jgi:tetratricopeptide (TPR) repeat protein
MVENQQSITPQGLSTFLSFGAKSVQPEILEELLIGRQQNVDFLAKCVNDIAYEGLNHQLMVVGRRGMGKTHILRVLYHRLQPALQENKIVVAYFAEEEYGISGYLDFLIRILNAFLRWNDADVEKLNSEMDILRETHPNRQIEVAERIITEYVGERPLLILAENFDNVLETLGKDGQGKLRSFLYRHTHTSIIATSQALSPDLGREDRPFYNFFTTIYLKNLSYEDSLALLQKLAEKEEQSLVIEHLKGKGKAQVRAIHELVKGNHRLLVTFYEFLKADTLASLSTIFIKTLNDLKPYFESFIRYLPPQQQKILHYLALAKMPQFGTEISKNCFIDQKSLSKQLSELQRKNLIDALPDPDDKRNKRYDIAEPLLRISIEIGEHREGISSLFIDFLALYYSYEELMTQKERFQSLHTLETDPLRKRDLYFDLKAREDAIIRKQEYESNRVESKAFRNMKKKYEENDFKAVIKWAEKVENKERDENYYGCLGYVYGVVKEYEKSIYNYKKSIEIEPEDHITWYNLALTFDDINEFDDAVESYEKSIILDSTYYQSWHNLGVLFLQLENVEKAIEIYEKATIIVPENFEVWYDLGVAFTESSQYGKAIENYIKATKLNQNLHQAWHNLGWCYLEIGSEKEGIEVLFKSILTGVVFINNQSRDVKKQVLSNISENILFILQNDKSLSINQLKDIESIIENGYGMPKELKIPYLYVQIYRRYVLEKEEKALFELPKEQREFFMREIVNKNKGV